MLIAIFTNYWVFSTERVTIQIKETTLMPSFNASTSKIPTTNAPPIIRYTYTNFGLWHLCMTSTSSEIAFYILEIFFKIH